MSYYIPPSSLLGDLDSNEIDAISRRFQNTPLRVGIVMESYDIDNQKNISKNIPEYTVVTKESNPSGGIDYKKYTNVISLDKFGGIADFFEYRLRPNIAIVDKESNKPSYDFARQNGSLVLLLCLDGFSEQAIIIGGLPNIIDQKTQRKTTLTKENALHMEGEYNGINWKVNKDGEFTLTFKSPTDNNGKVINNKYSGTFVKIDKTGSFQAKDKHNFVKMDNDKGGISLTTDATQTTNADKNIELTAKADFVVKSNKWNTEIAGSATNKAASWGLEVSGDVNIKASGPIKLDSSLLDVKTKSVNVQANKITLGVGGAPALILSTKFIGTGNAGAPVVSSPIGPFSSVVFIK
jgi:hypothetical protein